MDTGGEMGVGALVPETAADLHRGRGDIIAYRSNITYTGLAGYSVGMGHV